MLGALAWGFGEATLFFIVPDVYLTVVAMRRPLATALKATVWVTAGALVGGTAMYLWGAYDQGQALAVLDRVPAISAAMLDEVGQEIGESGAVAVLFGPPQGQPYKIYAVQAGAAGMSFAAFLAISVPARIIRFVLAVLLTALVARWLRPRTTPRFQLGVLAVFWTVNYAIYFTFMPG